MGNLILASASPRRAELLTRVGVKFVVAPSNSSEILYPDEAPQSAAKRLAWEKSELVSQQYPEHFVLAADTVVFVKCGVNFKLLGKPSSENEAIEMLRLLSGVTHGVVTGVSLRALNASVSETVVVESKVEFVQLSESDIRWYVASGEVMDKAGAYAVQGIGAAFVRTITGSPTNVIGLPLVEVLQLLDRYGLWHR